MGLIIDTSFFIRAERERNADWRQSLPRNEEIGISSITLSEITVGLLLADRAEIYVRRKAFIDGVMEYVPIFDFTVEIARVHATTLVAQRRSGKMIGAHDLIIAATALSLGWDVLTFNAAEFGQIEGLGIRTP